MRRDFTTVLRGYDKSQVDSVLGDAVQALAGGLAQRAAARDALSTAAFGVVLRGYDRLEVDDAVRALLREFDAMAASDGLRLALGSVLRLSEPTDHLIVEEVRRLRSVADQHNL